ncbi:putative eukaryotic translation initiation factor 4E binding protein [Apostichopus japonicus]|uniref:Putative eukaryotic translation initiation factor 4E binding protein n=1 Tax=Stichopus japonicus TaxID=307972 RepID=A0A2G8LJJ8_STIJA|nr:putative eukaryotic translation initiation factor 4E binding protein [Apostichopus japonicus]
MFIVQCNNSEKQQLKQVTKKKNGIPKGTRIIYDRDFLMQFRQSPLAQTPPKNLPNIPGVTNVGEPTTNGSAQPPKPNSNAKDGAIIEAEEPQFEMDI